MIQWFCATSFSLKYQRLFFAFLANRPHSFSNLPPNEHSSSPWQVEKAAPAPSPLIGSQATAWHRHWRMSRVAPIGILGLRVQVCHLPGSRHDPQPWLTRRQDATSSKPCWLLLNHCFVFGQVHKWDFEDLEILCCLASTHSLSPFAGTEAGGLLGTECWLHRWGPESGHVIPPGCSCVINVVSLETVGFDSWIEQPSRFSHYPSRLAFRNPTPVSQIMSMYVMYCAHIYAHVYSIILIIHNTYLTYYTVHIILYINMISLTHCLRFCHPFWAVFIVWFWFACDIPHASLLQVCYNHPFEHLWRWLSKVWLEMPWKCRLAVVGPGQSRNGCLRLCFIVWCCIVIHETDWMIIHSLQCVH